MIKLIHGDCLEEMKNIPDGSVDAVICDPPYGTTDCKWDSVIDLELMWEQLKRIVKQNGAIVISANQPFTSKLISSNYKMFKYCWVWDKKKPSTGLHAKIMPLKVAEDIAIFGSAKIMYNPQMRKVKQRNDKERLASNGDAFGGKYVLRKHSNNGMMYPKSILEISNANQTNRFHPTQKPVALMEYLIKTYTDENETVLDFTMGSGTTGVACKNLNRKFIGIELDGNYFNIAKNRIEGCK